MNERSKRAVPLLLLVVLAAAVRFYDLAEPNFKVFDEDFYASDACTYVVEGQFLCGDQETTFEHPPVAKWLIAAGIWMFTPTAFGSRVAVATFGVLSVAVLFLLARRLLRSVAAATIAAGLLALDTLHLVSSRTAILEVFGSFFVLASFLCYVLDRDERARGANAVPTNGITGGGDISRNGFSSRWRVAAGVMLGLAVGSKWTMAPVVPAIIFLVVLDAKRRREADGSRSSLPAALRSEFPSIALALILVPAFAYSFSFVGRIEGAFLAAPWDETSWYHALLTRQVEMFEYHLDLRRHFSGSRAPFQSSPAWSWPLVQRPIPFAFAVRDGLYREILALGNPLVWWPGLAAVVACVLRALRRGRDRSAAWVILGGLCGTYLYWLLLGPDVTNTFIYYFLATVPFLCLALGAVAQRLLVWGWGRITVGLYMALIVGSFAFFYPVLTWRPLAPDQWRTRVPFDQCEHYDVGDKEVVAGHPFPVDDLFGFPIPAYPDGLPDEKFIPLLTSREGWCWR